MHRYFVLNLKAIGAIVAGIATAVTSVGMTIHRDPAKMYDGISGFSIAVKEVSTAARCDIIADDTPVGAQRRFHPRIGSSDPVGDLCREFDYEAKECGRSVFFLQKRFSEQGELPQFNLADAMDVGRDVHTVLNSFGTHPAPGGVAAELNGVFESLSAQQRLQLMNHGRIEVRALTRQQQQAVGRALVHQAFATLPEVCEQFYSELHGIATSTIEIPQRDPTRQTGDRPAATNTFVYAWQDKTRSWHVTFPQRAGFVAMLSVPPVFPRPTNSGELSHVDTASVTKNLDRTAVIEMGETTLGALAAALSAQTGVDIRADASIAPHRLVVSARSMTAQRLLNLLCQNNEWELCPAEAGGIVIRRPSPGKATSAGAAYRALLKTLPADWQRYIVSGAAWAASPSTRDAALMKAGTFHENVAVPAMRQKIALAASTCGEKLVASLISTSGERARFSYRDMNEEQRYILTQCVALDFLLQLCETPAAAAVFLDKPAPYQFDIGSAFLSVHDGGIWVESITEQETFHGRRGFGASLGGGRR